MASIPTLSVRGSRPTLQAEEIEDKPTMVAKSFVSMMDNSMGWSPQELHEDAVMDWFGCCLRGRSSIIYFLRSHVQKTHHVIEQVRKIPPILHRLMKKSNSEAIYDAPNQQMLEECGQGDCKGLITPENAVLPNLKEMVKAPRARKYVSCSVDWEKCEYLEIRGRVEFEAGEPVREKKLDRIVLGYTDQIHLIVYEAKNNCRKKLFS